MNKRDYENLILRHNDNGHRLLPLAFLDHGEAVYFYRGHFCVNLGSGFLRLDLDDNNIRGVNVDIR